MTEEKSNKQSDSEETLPSISKKPVSSIQLGVVNSLDLTGLNEEQMQTLQMKHAESLIDINKKAHEMKVDVGALSEALGTMAEQTKQVSEAGDSVTITHSQSNALGRTEVIMGNTDKAAKGKLSRSQAGDKDNMLMYIIVGAVAAIIITLTILR